MQDQPYLEIKTDRLLLHTPTEADAEAVRTIGRDEFATKEAALECIRWVKNKAYENRLIYGFYIWLSQTNRCIGRVYLHAKPELGGEAEIGYGILEEHRQKGYATEAEEAAIRFAFEKAALDSLVAIVKPENTASQHVIKKLWFANLGVRTVPDENGKACAFDFFQRSCHDWRPAHPAVIS